MHKNRIEAITRSLRRFGKIDDFGLCELFAKPSLPTLAVIKKSISDNIYPMPSGLSAGHIAKAILVEVARSDKDTEVTAHGIGIPLTLIKIDSINDLLSLAELCIDRFKHVVEQKRGNSLIHDETEAQVLFDAVSEPIALIHNVDFSREVETGRGPVDFKLSSGASLRMFIELKRASNSQYWNGLKKQLPAYLFASEISHGLFVTLVDNDKELKRISKIDKMAQELSDSNGISVKNYTVKVYKPVSASKLK